MTDAIDISPELLPKPVVTLEQATPLLRRPFTPDAVLWKVQASFRNFSAALIVPYIDARLAADRLDVVCGSNWQEGDPERDLPAFKEVQGGLLCNLVVFGIPRSDVGSGYPGNTKGLYSDAFKRAAVKWGVGRPLYAFPKTTLEVNEHGHLEKREIKTKKGPKTINVLTAKGLEHIRGVYKLWLEDTGVQVFGRPLDHGDRGVSTGDVEAEGVAGADEPVDEAESEEAKKGKEHLQGSIRSRRSGDEEPQP